MILIGFIFGIIQLLHRSVSKCIHHNNIKDLASHHMVRHLETIQAQGIIKLATHKAIKVAHIDHQPLIRHIIHNSKA